MSWIEDPGWEEYRDHSLSDLGVDEAYVNVSSRLYSAVYLYSLSDECYNCPYKRVQDFSYGDSFIKVSTKHGASWRILSSGLQKIIPRQDRSGLLCELEPNFGEFGVYDLVIRGSGTDVFCSMVTVQKPVNIYLPMLVCLFGLVLVWLLCYLISYTVRRWKRHKKNIIIPTSAQPPTPETADKPTQPTPPRQRLKSLDTFRGISIILMIFVNDGAGGYWFLEHATWNGLQIADVLFPWFMWIMGVCIPISVKSQLKKNVPRSTMLIAVTRRACILYLLGLILNSMGNTRLENLRLFGVLQRFGIVYFIVTTLSIFLTCRSYGTPKIPFVALTQDIIVLLPQWLIMIGLVAGHCAITFYLEVPGCPKGYLGPGGIQDNGQYKNCIGGATGYLDKIILGEDHIYQYPTADEIYGSGPFDPEGVIGCLLSIFQVFLGIQAGTTLSFYRDWKQRLNRWIAWGSVTGVIGAILCLCSKEDGWIPVNKNLWSLSFVMVTSCFAFYLLSACYFLIDVKGWWDGTPFFYPGMNATIMYVGHSVASQMFPWHWAIGDMNTHFMRLVESLWGTGLWVLVAFWLYNIKFFLSL